MRARPVHRSRAITLPYVTRPSALDSRARRSPFVVHLLAHWIEQGGRKMQSVAAHAAWRLVSCSRSMGAEADTAAVVPSPTAVLICRVSWALTSPTDHIPSTEVRIAPSVTRYPEASCSAWTFRRPELGKNPAKMKTP